MTTIRELITRFGLDFDQPAFKRADNAVTSLKHGAQALVAVWASSIVVRELRDIVSGTIDAGAKLGDMADKTGVSTAAIQELRYAAELSGVSLEQFDRGLTIVSKMAGEAAAGVEAATKSFADYGISLRDANGVMKTGDQLLADLANKSKAAKSPVEALAIATTFFGAKNSDMAILLREGADGIETMRAEARELGFVMSSELIQQTKDLDDRLVTAKQAVQGMKNALAEQLIPFVREATDAFIDWWKANKGTVRAIMKTVATVARATVAFGKWLAQSWLLKAAIVALGAYIGGTFLVALGSALAGIMATVGGMNAWAAVALLTKIRMLALQAVALAQLAAIGAAALVTAVFIALLGEEIAAVFDDDKIGLFERMQGKWDKLRDSMLKGLGGESNPLIVVLRLAGAYIAQLIDLIDSITETQFRMLNKLIEMGGSAKDFFVGPGAAATTATPTYDQRSAASLGTMGGVTSSVVVHVDARGGDVDGKTLGRQVAAPVSTAIEDTIGQAHRALTPALAGS